MRGMENFIYTNFVAIMIMKHAGKNIPFFLAK